MRSEYTRLLGEVGDRVLNGYQMEQVMLQLGTQTQVTMVVSPWNEVINDVFVDLQFSGVEENTAALLQSKLPELQKTAGGCFAGFFCRCVRLGRWSITPVSKGKRLKLNCLNSELL